MKNIFKYIVTVFLLGVITCVYGMDKVFEGGVYDAISNSGISGLTIKLTTPKSKGPQQQITTTDEKGEFIFDDVKNGKYMLEVCQGLTILHRSVVEIDGNAMPFRILLKRKRQ